MVYSNSVFKEDKINAMIKRTVQKQYNKPDHRIANRTKNFKGSDLVRYYSKHGDGYGVGLPVGIQRKKILDKIKNALNVTMIGSIILATIVLSIIILFTFFGNGNFIAHPVIG